ncbi:MAG: hypothetical protein V4616_11615 [Bacteroidota bacterium]
MTNKAAAEGAEQRFYFDIQFPRLTHRLLLSFLFKERTKESVASFPALRSTHTIATRSAIWSYLPASSGCPHGVSFRLFQKRMRHPSVLESYLALKILVRADHEP